jgi:hypothetical protein
MSLPKLLTELLAAGHSRIDFGNVKLDLRTGKITRTISLDGKAVAEPEFPTGEIDWDVVEKARR